jgi:hypothetical protein
MATGYVVIEKSGGAMAIGEGGALWIPSGRVPQATLFADLNAARQAIARTQAYAKARGYKWDDDYRVVRLKPARS